MPTIIRRPQPKIRLLPQRGVPAHRGSRERSSKAACRHAPNRGLSTLKRHLYSLSELAPNAPLSFLIVQLNEQGPDVCGEALAAIRDVIRPMDRAELYDRRQIGIILQGAGAGRSTATAARIDRYLRQPNVLPAVAGALISAATGTGRNALTLPVAATSTFDDFD